MLFISPYITSLYAIVSVTMASHGRHLLVHLPWITIGRFPCFCLSIVAMSVCLCHKSTGLAKGKMERFIFKNSRSKQFFAFYHCATMYAFTLLGSVFAFVASSLVISLFFQVWKEAHDISTTTHTHRHTQTLMFVFPNKSL